MDEQFTTYGTAEVMVANITPEQAAALEPKIKEIKGVQSVDYDETTAHYNNLSASIPSPLPTVRMTRPVSTRSKP